MPTMNATEENPFRLLGLSVDATDRQIAKRVNELSTLYEFGKTKSYDTDFPFISTVTRTPEAIERAASQIELPEQKLFHANFWFWSGNSIDECNSAFIRPILAHNTQVTSMLVGTAQRALAQRR